LTSDDVGGGGVEQLLASAATVDERDTHLDVVGRTLG